jgi:hypothetical protein
VGFCSNERLFYVLPNNHIAKSVTAESRLLIQPNGNALGKYAIQNNLRPERAI